MRSTSSEAKERRSGYAAPTRRNRTIGNKEIISLEPVTVKKGQARGRRRNCGTDGRTTGIPFPRAAVADRVTGTDRRIAV